MSDLNAVLEGDGFSVSSSSWSNPYESFVRQVTPGTYRLGVSGSPGSACQHYTVFASLYPSSGT